MPKEFDIHTIAKDNEMRIDVVVWEETMSYQICFKVKNLITSLMECNVITWLMNENTPNRIPFYLKAKSDSNKEQWARILNNAFGRDYPWTVIVAKVAAEVENQIKAHKQDFVATEIEPKPCTWLLEPFIQEDMINTIFGMGSAGKTLIALYFAKQYVIEHEEGNVLFVDYEDTPGGWKEKLTKIIDLQGSPIDLNRFIYYASEQIPVSEQIDKIKDVIKDRNIKLVIVDSASLATGESTSDEKAAIRLVSALHLLKTTCLIIAHQRKNEGEKNPIGSIQYENQSRNVWNVKGASDDKDNTIIHIAMTHTKANNTWKRKEPYGYRIEYKPESIQIIRESAQTYFEESYTAIQRIEKLLRDEGSFDTKGVAQSLGLTNNYANKILSKGKQKGIFVNNNGLWSYQVPLVIPQT
jgi:hypothetical protein